MTSDTVTALFTDKLRTAGIIATDDSGYPHFDPDRAEMLLDELYRLRAEAADSLPTYHGEPIPHADIRRLVPSQDYFALKEECWKLLNRIMIEGRFLGDRVPADLSWVHVAAMAHIRAQLREINDQLFAEGAYAG